jgi:hypothetical protein
MDNPNIIGIILEATDRNTGPVIQGATSNVTKLGNATKLTADQEKRLNSEFQQMSKVLGPAAAAQQVFAGGQETLQKGLKEGIINQAQYTRGVELLRAELGQAADVTDRASVGFARLGSSLGGTAIATALLLVGRASLTAAQEAEQASARVESIIKATGSAAGFTKTQLDGLADSLAASTRFDDEELRNGIAVLLSFRNVSEDSFARALSLSTDLAELMQTDFKSAVLQLGKALQEPETGINALTRAGVTFSDAQKEVIKQMIETGDRAGAMTLILDELERQVGGTAERINSGLTKSTVEAGKAWDELMEAFGKTTAVQVTATGGLGLITNELKEMKGVVENGDWLDRILYVAKLNLGLIPGLALPDIESEKPKEDVSGKSQEERLAREGKLQQEINTLLETRSGLEKKLQIERSKDTLKNLTDQRDGIKEQIQGYKSLRQAMLQAFTDAGRAAQDARERAQGFLDKASTTRQGAKDRILSRKIDGIASPDTTGLSEEDAAFVKARAKDEADAARASAVSDRLYQASVLRAKALEELSKGNVDGSQRLLDLSDEQLDRANQFAEQLEDEARARSAIEDVANRSAENNEQRAAIEEKRAKEEAERREALGKKIAENDTSLEALNSSLTDIEQRMKTLSEEKATVSLQADEAAFNDVNARLDALLKKKAELARPVAVQAGVNTVQTGGATQTFFPGGPVRGPGSRSYDSVSGLLRVDEHVWTPEEVDSVGGHDAMYRLRQLARMGLLHRFDIGGAVGSSHASRSVINRILMPAMANQIQGNVSGDTINLTIEGMGTYQVQATQDTSRSLQSDAKHAALMHGSRG